MSEVERGRCAILSESSRRLKQSNIHLFNRRSTGGGAVDTRCGGR
jgi:hypothetical protein